MNLLRVRRLIETAVHTFDLDLQGLRVLTEAATGYYALTPIIAALAGAQRVYALARDSGYGTAARVSLGLMRLAQRFGISERIEILQSREDRRLRKADLVTNLGFVRPLDREFLHRLNPSVVIPLMWETWEFRPEDLDLEECRRLNIPVMGTNEHHPDLQTFEYIGPLAMKLLFKVDLEVFRSSVVVVGSDELAKNVVKTLRSQKARVSLLNLLIEGMPKKMKAQEVLRRADALILVEHRSRKMLIGDGGALSPRALYALNPNLVVVHICGNADRAALKSAGFRCYPNRFAQPSHMSVTTDYLGPRPLIDLHTAGLKVGALMWEKKQILKSATKMEQALAEEHSLCQRLAPSCSIEG